MRAIFSAESEALARQVPGKRQKAGSRHSSQRGRPPGSPPLSESRTGAVDAIISPRRRHPLRDKLSGPKLRRRPVAAAPAAIAAHPRRWQRGRALPEASAPSRRALRRRADGRPRWTVTAAAASPGPGRCRRVCRGPARALPARFPRATGGWSAGDTRRAEEPRPGHRQCATAVGTGTLCHGRACDEGERGSQKPRGPRLGRRRGRKARGPPTPPPDRSVADVQSSLSLLPDTAGRAGQTPGPFNAIQVATDSEWPSRELPAWVAPSSPPGQRPPKSMRVTGAGRPRPLSSACHLQCGFGRDPTETRRINCRRIKLADEQARALGRPASTSERVCRDQSGSKGFSRGGRGSAWTVTAIRPGPGGCCVG